MNLFDFAIQYVGQKEVKGPQSNQVILQMIQQYNLATVDDSKIAWCSIFLMFLCDSLGLNRFGSTMAARSWLKVGTKVPIHQVQKGDLVILKRHGGPDWWGHVGVFGSWDLDGNPILCSGNYGNAVTVDMFTIEDVLGVVRVT